MIPSSLRMWIWWSTLSSILLVLVGWFSNLVLRGPSAEEEKPPIEEDLPVDEPFVEAAEHLTLSNQCVQGIARQVHRSLLAGKQSRDLSSKLLKTVGNINELIYKFEASSTDAFQPALESFHMIADKASSLVQDCGSTAEWHRASVFQIYNEEAFREILQELGLCYNVIYEQAKNMSLSNGLVLGVEDLRQGAIFSPTSDSDVADDQEAMQRRLEDLAVRNARSASDDRVVLARYLLGRLLNGRVSKERRIDASAMYDASLLKVTAKELQRTWYGAPTPIGKGSGAESIYRTKWHGIPSAKKIFWHQEVNVTFQEEAAVLASLNHPNIVKLFCCGNERHEGVTKCFIGMEILSMSLSELIRRRAPREGQPGKPFPIHVALDIILQIARGMLYLHDLGIAHRDLKPQNVVVEKVGNNNNAGSYNAYRVKLVDFGMSKTKVQVSKSNTVSKKGTGTTAYRAPEAFPDHPKDAQGRQKVKWFRADVYSFALTCSTILSLQEPYAEEGKGTLYWKLVRTSPPPIRPELPRDCPKELSDLLDECWTTSPNARPKFADICARLEKFKHDRQRGPNIVKQGRQTVDRFLSNSHSYIDDVLAKRSELRTPVKHIAPNADDALAPVPSDDEANVSDDETEQLVHEDSGVMHLDLEWISSRKKKLTVTAVDGENADLNDALKKACEKFCKGINMTVIPTTVERGQAMIDGTDQLRALFPQYNVMLVHPHHHREVEEYAHCTISLKIYKYVVGSVQVYLFKRGKFTLLGDGGFINWSFGGKYERNDNKVTFWDIPADPGLGFL